MRVALCCRISVRYDDGCTVSQRSERGSLQQMGLCVAVGNEKTEGCEDPLASLFRGISMRKRRFPKARSVRRGRHLISPLTLPVPETFGAGGAIDEMATGALSTWSDGSKMHSDSIISTSTVPRRLLARPIPASSHSSTSITTRQSTFNHFHGPSRRQRSADAPAS